VALQEMNLATKYNPLYWDCACLCVNSGNSVTDLGDDDDSDDDPVDDSVNEKSDNGNDPVDDSVNDTPAPEGKKAVKRIAPNYGKIAKAISDVQQRGVDVTLPDINESDVDFLPNTSKNAIEYSLGAADNFPKTEDKKKYAIPAGHCTDFFLASVKPALNAAKNEYETAPDGGYCVKVTSMDKFKSSVSEEPLEWLSSPAGRDAYLKVMVSDAADAAMAEIAQGTPSDWEMETLVYYHSGHPLSKVDRVKYGIRSFDGLPEQPQMHTATNRDGRSYQVCDDITTLVGTVVNADSAKHIVSLLTPDGVVSVKLFKNNYVSYAKKLSYNDPNHKGKKITIEDSWFKRGTKLLVNGYRRDNMFMVKGSFDRERPWRRMPIQIIEEVGDASGSLKLRDHRKAKGE
jgi:DNA polymerase III alpha subunit